MQVGAAVQLLRQADKDRGLSGGALRLNAFQDAGELVAGFAHLVECLGVHPKFGRGAEEARQADCRVGRDPALFASLRFSRRLGAQTGV